MVKNYFWAIVLSLFFAEVNSQCFDTNFAFQENELIEYEVFYNWGFIWLNAGYVDFKVRPGSYIGRPVYHLDAWGSSHKNYDWIFKVRDRYQCYLDRETLRPLWFLRENYEGGFEVNYRYFFDQDKHKVYAHTQNSDRPFKKDTVDISSCTFDVLSVVYFCRNLDFSKMNPGDSIPLSSILDREVFDLYVRYLGRENITTKDGKTYRCIKFSALLIEGTIFKGGEDLFVWVTDDLNRIPVLVEAKIIIGSVKAYLESMQDLRHPVTSLLYTE
jgi:hypothetical protein